jgi:chemotaxis protein MotA
MRRVPIIVISSIGIALVATTAALTTGTIAFLWNPEAIAIVLGGSILASIAGSSPEHMVAALRALRAGLRPNADALTIAQWWIQVAIQWRHEGFSGLTRAVSSAPSTTAAALAELCADGLDAETIVSLAEEMVETHYRSYEGAISVYRRLAGYAPTMGIIGTVIGLAAALGNSGADPIQLLSRIGFAFSATLWGLVTANFLWLPLAQRLQSVLQQDRALNRLNIRAVQLATQGTSPLLMRYHLAMLLPEQQRKQFLHE